MTAEVVEGDALAVLKTLPDGIAQTCVTSPPYWGLRDYQIGNQIGLESTPEEYVARMVEVFAEVRRVLRDDGTVWLNLGDSYTGAANSGGAEGKRSNGQCTGNAGRMVRLSALPAKSGCGLKPKDLIGIPWRVAFALQADGWYLRSDVIWAKPNPMPESVEDRPTKAHEYVFLLAKRERYYYDADAIREGSVDPPGVSRGGSLSRFGRTEKFIASDAHRGETILVSNGFRNRRTVWTITPEPFPEAHFATMPQALVEPCILAGSSPKACETCGAPWERVIERTVPIDPGRGDSKLRDGPFAITGSIAQRTAQRRLGQAYQDQLNTNPVRTTGWRPTCAHDAPGGRSLVLDPFAGSGTVGVVALRHGRRFLGIDLNPDYVAMARRRVLGPLFADVSTEGQTR